MGNAERNEKYGSSPIAPDCGGSAWVFDRAHVEHHSWSHAALTGVATAPSAPFLRYRFVAMSQHSIAYLEGRGIVAFNADFRSDAPEAQPARLIYSIKASGRGIRAAAPLQAAHERRAAHAAALSG